MIINLSGEELQEAVLAYMAKYDVGASDTVSVRIKGGRKGNLATAVVAVNESLPETVPVKKKPKPQRELQLELPDDNDSDPVPEVQVFETDETEVKHTSSLFD